MKQEQTSISDSFSWNRERTPEELNFFISRKLGKFDLIAQEIELAVAESQQ